MKNVSACLLVLLALIAPSLMADTIKARHVSVNLLTEQPAVVAGESVWLLLQFTPEEGWHTYWKNPGDSGLAPVLKWALPAGWHAREPHYPTPEAIPYGSQMNYGYHDTNSLLVELVPPTTMPGNQVDVKLNARWLVCADACIPGQGNFALTLPVAENVQTDPERAKLFAHARASLPVALDTEGTFSIDDNHVTVTLPASGLPDGDLQVFIAPGQIAEPTAKPVLSRQNDHLLIKIARHTYFSEKPNAIEVVLTQSGKGWSIPAQPVSQP